jgi:hypothetical protein
MEAHLIWSLIQWVHYLALSLWIGGIVFVSAVVAPVAHASMASKALAGQIVGKSLKRLNTIELVCCFFLIATTFLAFRFVSGRPDNLWTLLLVILCMGILTSFYTFYLTPRLEKIKEEVPTFDSLSANHPAKVEFHRWHTIYVWLMMANLILGLGVLYGSIIILK